MYNKAGFKGFLKDFKPSEIHEGQEAEMSIKRVEKLSSFDHGDQVISFKSSLVFFEGQSKFTFKKQIFNGFVFPTKLSLFKTISLFSFKSVTKIFRLVPNV